MTPPACVLSACPLTAAMCAVAAALHETSGLHEHWDARAFAELIAMPGTEGRLTLDGNLPIGLALWRVAADEAEILTICTAPDRRRQGAGRFLLEAVIAAISAAGAKRLLLEVAIDNGPAIALYQAFGFVEAGRRHGYYRTAQGPIDALILAREI
jgi:ribosomal-protein-alanine N-acetyltransferase